MTFERANFGSLPSETDELLQLKTGIVPWALRLSNGVNGNGLNVHFAPRQLAKEALKPTRETFFPAIRSNA